MRRVIKITESQLREADSDAFKYLDANDDSHPFNGQSTITAQGKIDGENNAEPIFTDRISKQRTPQSWARYRMYGNINKPPHAEPKSLYDEDLVEGVNLFDKDDDGVSDHYENVGDIGGLDTLSDGDDSNNLTVIPKSVDYKLDNLDNALKNLTPKQKAMVVNKFLESNDLSQIPYSWKKELMYKLISNNDGTNNIK